MILDKTKAFTLLMRLLAFCKSHSISLPKGESLKYYSVARIVTRRYGTVVLVDNDDTRYLCNNYKYLKRWALGQSTGKAGEPYRMVNCGRIAKKEKKHNKTLQHNG